MTVVGDRLYARGEEHPREVHEDEKAAAEQAKDHGDAAKPVHPDVGACRKPEAQAADLLTFLDHAKERCSPWGCGPLLVRYRAETLEHIRCSRGIDLFACVEDELQLITDRRLDVTKVLIGNDLVGRALALVAEDKAVELEH